MAAVNCRPTGLGALKSESRWPYFYLAFLLDRTAVYGTSAANIPPFLWLLLGPPASSPSVQNNRQQEQNDTVALHDTPGPTIPFNKSSRLTDQKDLKTTPNLWQCSQTRTEGGHHCVGRERKGLPHFYTPLLFKNQMYL